MEQKIFKIKYPSIVSDNKPYFEVWDKVLKRMVCGNYKTQWYAINNISYEDYTNFENKTINLEQIISKYGKGALECNS